MVNCGSNIIVISMGLDVVFSVIGWCMVLFLRLMFGNNNLDVIVEWGFMVIFIGVGFIGIDIGFGLVVIRVSGMGLLGINLIG